MSIMSTLENSFPAVETPLLSEKDDIVKDSLNYLGHPAKRSNSGGWLSASFIIVAEMAVYFAYYGVSANLISYLTGPLGHSTATAAENVNAWSGIAMLMPLFGAFVADSYLGRYRTIIVASVLYILGLGLLALSAFFPSLMSSNCQTTSSSSILCHPAPQLQAILFFFSLYLIAIAQGMHKPCIHAFGADQFDASDTEECKSKSSFFNWCNASDCLAITITYFTLTYIQDNLSWGLGFGIPCLAVVFALVWFLLGTFTYRFHTTNNDDQGQGKSEPFSRIGRVFIKAAKNWRTISCAEDMDAENQGQGFPNSGSQEFRFLNKALLSSDGTMEEGHVCSINEVEEAKAILRLVPIWCSCLAYGIVFSQASTLFTKQGLTMERFITSTIQIPAASLQSFTSITIIVSLCIYDRILVPTARAITGKTSGITMLQRIGTGIFFSFSCVLAAALVEERRLEVIEEFDLVDLPDATVPMSVAWLLPQYLLLGVSCTFTVTGLQQFFYDQMPNELRSTGLAISFTAIGLGELLSSLLISVIQKITGGLDEYGNPWISDNPMKGHVDYFYWLLVGLSALSFVAFLYFAKGYTYRNQ